MVRNLFKRKANTSDEQTGSMLVQKSRLRIPSGSRRETKMNRRVRTWVQQHIYKKEEVSGVIREVPTDAFGEVDFRGATRKAKAKFVRCSDSTNPSDIFNLMTKHWHLEKPRLLISVLGGAKKFNLHPRLKEVFATELLKVAQTPGAWVITGGTNTGVMQHVGEALQGITKACIGISTWGIVTNREHLISSSEQGVLGDKFPYQVSCSLVEKGAYLDHNHTHHLMVDDGSEGIYGAEISFRSRFEKYIHGSAAGKVPAVLLILEGGLNTIESIFSAVSDDSPISIVVVKGSGRAANVIAHAVCYVNDPEEDESSGTSRYAGLLDVIDRYFPELGEEDRKMYCQKVLFCLKKRESFTIFQVGGETALDEAIMMALLKGQKASPFAQLQLTLLWNRADLAQEKILSQTYRWKTTELEYAMVIALALDRVDFVKLLLEYGVCINSLLTNDMLEFLYGYQSQSYASTLKFEFDEKEYYISANLYKYGELINLLCNFEGFNPMKCAIPRRTIQRILALLCKNLMVQGERDFIENLYPQVNYEENIGFKFPYRELFFWAVLNNKHKMAMYLWEFEEEAMSKALIAAEINNVMFEHSQKLDLQDELVKSFSSNAADFKDLALKILDECYRTSESQTVKLITSDFKQFPKQTCLGIAVHTNDLEYVSHSSVQGLLSEVWTGAIKRREVSDYQLFFAFIFPPYISSLAFASVSEVDSMVYVDDDDDFAFVEEIKKDNEIAMAVKGDDGLNIIIDASSRKNAVRTASKRRTFSYKDNKKCEETSTPYYKKLYEFYFNTPVVKFYASLALYFVFLLLFGYVSLLKKEYNMLGIPETILIAYVVSITVAEIHQISQGHGHSLNVKLREWSYSKWNILDACTIILFFVALGLQLHQDTADIGHVCYAIDGGMWIIRLLKVLYVDSILGPYVVMISKMIKDTLYFLVVLLIFLFAYGVSAKGVLEPQGEEVDLMQMVIKIFFHPYFNIFGEFFNDRDPKNNKTTRFGTPVINSYAEPVHWCLLAVYLLITNVLLMNLLIAIFNHTFNSVQLNAAQIWKFERYGLVLEYAKGAPIAPPLSLPVHIFFFIRYLFQKCGICENKSDGSLGLRCSVSCEEKGELIEFENKCMASFVRKREALLGKSIEEASVEILARLEGVKASIKCLEERFRKIEEKEVVSRTTSIWGSLRSPIE